MFLRKEFNSENAAFEIERFALNKHVKLLQLSHSYQWLQAFMFTNSFLQML